MGEVVRPNFKKKKPLVKTNLIRSLNNQDEWLVELTITNVECITNPQESTEVWGDTRKALRKLCVQDNIQIQGTSTMDHFIDDILINAKLDRWLESTSRDNISLVVSLRAESIPNTPNSILHTTTLVMKDQDKQSVIYTSENKYSWFSPKGKE